MAFVVVRCLGCRGAARVAGANVGTSVECPRCGVAFKAIEEATLVVPGAGWVPPNPPPPRPWRGPAAPPIDLDEYDIYDDEDEYDSDIEEDEDRDEEERAAPRPLVVERPQPKTEHDADEDKPLPASVFIGLSLLPFVIPIVWFIASVVAKPPMLTIGTPIALALATSVLCLAVISTIDWTPATQVKGVLLLVVLSYLTGLGLYFLKRDMVERVRKFFGNPHALMQDAPQGAGYSVLVPGDPREYKGVPPVIIVSLNCRQTTQPSLQGPYTFVYGSSPSPKGDGRAAANAELGTEAWFEKVKADIVKQAMVPLAKEPLTISYIANNEVFPGREYVLKLQGQQGVSRVVRVYVIKGRVYYLSVERKDLDTEEDDLVREFFDSFEQVQ